MITGPHDVLPVRPTASTSGNALRRPVRRISVGSLVICSAWWAVSAGIAADAKKDDGAIRIIPATKSHSAPPPAPMIDQMRRGQTAKPATKAKPPARAEAVGQGSASAGRSRPRETTATSTATANPTGPPRSRGPQRAAIRAIYRSIPYSRSAYEVDPMYRQEIALSLLFNQFPPAPTIMSPGSSGMGPRGPMSPNRGGRQFGSPMNYGPSMVPPGIVPEF